MPLFYPVLRRVGKKEKKKKNERCSTSHLRYYRPSLGFPRNEPFRFDGNGKDRRANGPAALSIWLEKEMDKGSSEMEFLTARSWDNGSQSESLRG